MPRPLAEHLAAVGDRLRAAPRVLVYLDFDGTLAPICDRPFAVEPIPGARELLHALNAHPRSAAAVVSGRELDDLVPRVGVPGLACAGNHGLEITGPGLDFRHPEAVERRPHLAALVAELSAAVAGIPGAWVQDKGLSASVHFRQTDLDRIPDVEATVRRLHEPHRDRFVLRPGKMVLEVRPAVDWHKGRAIEWLTPRLGGGLPVFFGDDQTDEDGFRAATDGLTVLVGPPRPTAAQYRVDGPEQVTEFLRWAVETLG
ncbi:MAG: trehalose-phosphatase [Gemmataceae bacterium]